MYLWKCWRDTRIKFFVFLGLFICLEVAFIFSHKVSGSQPLSAFDLRDAFLIIFIAVGSVLLFLGWILGDENVGADIGRGSGDFLLTRPQTRGSFVWTGWALSMVEMVVLWIVFSTVVIADVGSLLHGLGVSSAVFRTALAEFSHHFLPVMFLTFLINVGLIFGVTYCIGVVLRSGSKALIGTAVLLFGYRILQAILKFRFHVLWPDILLGYPTPHQGMVVPALHDFIVRGIIALAFPLLAHLMMDRMEI